MNSCVARLWVMVSDVGKFRNVVHNLSTPEAKITFLCEFSFVYDGITKSETA